MQSQHSARIPRSHLPFPRERTAQVTIGLVCSTPCPPPPNYDKCRLCHSVGGFSPVGGDRGNDNNNNNKKGRGVLSEASLSLSLSIYIYILTK